MTITQHKLAKAILHYFNLREEYATTKQNSLLVQLRKTTEHLKSTAKESLKSGLPDVQLSLFQGQEYDGQIVLKSAKSKLALIEAKAFLDAMSRQLQHNIDQGHYYFKDLPEAQKVLITHSKESYQTLIKNAKCSA